MPGALLVTRPQHQAQAWVEALRAHGVQAHALPLIGISPAEDERPVLGFWQRQAMAPSPGVPPPAGPGDVSAHLAVFVSANAVHHTLAQRPYAMPWPAHLWAAATGPGTVAALVQEGVPATRVLAPDVEQGVFDSEALWHQRLSAHSWRNRQVWLLRGETGRNWLADTLAAQGAQVHTVVAYRRGPPRWSAQQHDVLHQALAQPTQWGWHFSASEGLVHLRTLVEAASSGSSVAAHGATRWGECRAAAPHPRIVQAAVDVGFVRAQQVGASAQAVALWWLRGHAGAARGT